MNADNHEVRAIFLTFVVEANMSSLQYYAENNPSLA